MTVNKKPDTRRAEMSFLFAIVMGLVLGVMIKKIRVGILIGLVLGFIIVLTGWMRSTRK
jgi:hypothetical protein